MALLARAAQASLGGARMGLMDFEARGSQGPQANVKREHNVFAGYPRPASVWTAGALPRGWLRRGLLTTRQRRKTQTLILPAPTKKANKTRKN